MGFRGPHRNRRDANEGEIIEALEAHGVGVHRMDTPCDLLCFYGGFTHPVEVKMPNGKLTPAQEKFHARFPDYVTILTTTEEAQEWARGIRGQQ